MNALVDFDALAQLVAARVLEGLQRQGLGADPIVDLRSLPAALRRHAYASARAGDLVASKVGKRWFTRQSALDAWLASHERDVKPATVEGASRWLDRGAA